MKNILHIIDTLNTGGAELQLIKTIAALQSGFKHTVVYLKKPDPLLPELKGYDVIFLDYKGKYSLPATVWQLRKIIKEKEIDIVHAHLFLSTILARLACPAHVKLVFQIHSILSDDAFKHNAFARLAEKLTYSDRQTAIFVSETVKEDYDAHIGLKGASYVLYNFVDDLFFNARKPEPLPVNNTIRMVAVGNLRVQKNYQFLLRAFEKLKNVPVTLDIYGKGNLKETLENQLKEKAISNIILKGYEPDIAAFLPDYHIFIAASENEGFCIAVAEAMAVGLPCLLSDIKTFREITSGNAVFFNLQQEQELVQKIKELSGIRAQLTKNTEQSARKALSFKQALFIQKLKDIYTRLQ